MGRLLKYVTFISQPLTKNSCILYSSNLLYESCYYSKSTLLFFWFSLSTLIHCSVSSSVVPFHSRAFIQCCPFVILSYCFNIIWSASSNCFVVFVYLFSVSQRCFRVNVLWDEYCQTINMHVTCLCSIRYVVSKCNVRRVSWFLNVSQNVW